MKTKKPRKKTTVKKTTKLKVPTKKLSQPKVNSNVRTPTQLTNEIATIFEMFATGYDSYASHLNKISLWVDLAKENGFPKDM